MTPFDYSISPCPKLVRVKDSQLRHVPWQQSAIRFALPPLRWRQGRVPLRARRANERNQALSRIFPGRLLPDAILSDTLDGRG